MFPIQRVNILGAAIMAAMVALAYALLTLHGRFGFGNIEIVPILKLLLLLVVNLSGLCLAYETAIEAPRRLALAPALFVLANAGFLVLAPHPMFGALVYPVLAILLVLGWKRRPRPDDRLEKWLLIGALPVGLMLGIVYFFATNAMGYAHILAPEAALIGKIHQDTMFHAATAGMLAQFGVLSTGLDGLTFVANHPLSHLVVGRLALWLDVTPVMAYALVPRILLLPLLMFVLPLATMLLWRPRSALGSLFPAMLVPLALMLGFEVFDPASHLVSESYMLALTLLFLALPVMGWLPKIELKRDVALACVVLLLLTVLTALAKMTVGFALAGGLGMMLMAHLAVQKSWTLLKALAWMIGIGVLALVVALLVRPAFRESAFNLIGIWEFVKRYPRVGYPNVLMGILGVAVSSVALWRMDRSRMVELCGLSGIALTGLVAGLIVSAPAGAQYYLINISAWIAFVTLASLVILPLLERVRAEGVGAGIAALLAIAAIAFTPAKTGAFSAWGATKTALRAEAKAAQRALATTEGRAPLPADAPFADQLANSFGGVLLATLKRDLVEDRRATLVFIPPSLAPFWTLNPNCRVPGWIVPGTLGVPLLSGVHAACDLLIYYGFDAYPAEARNREADDETLCARAKALGFKAVLRVERARATRRLACS